MAITDQQYADLAARVTALEDVDLRIHEGDLILDVPGQTANRMHVTGKIIIKAPRCEVVGCVADGGIVADKNTKPVLTNSPKLVDVTGDVTTKRSK